MIKYTLKKLLPHKEYSTTHIAYIKEILIQIFIKTREFVKSVDSVTRIPQ